MIRFEVLGECYSMKNSKTLTFRGGKPRTIKHEKAQQFEEDFLLQVPVDAKKNIDGPVIVSVWIWYPTLRQDLDAAIVFDLLQKAGVILNDKQIIEQHCFKRLDREKPRVFVEIRRAVTSD